MARRPVSELEFGSDSFLDIIANIVGILIILIVIAGLRAARAPVAVPSVNEPVKSPIVAAAPIRKAVPIPSPKPEPEPVVVIERPLPPRPLILPPLPSNTPTLRDDLLTQMQRLQDRIAKLTADRAELQNRLQRVTAERRSLDGSAAKLSASVRGRTSADRQLRAAIDALRAKADRGKQELALLRRQYDEAGRQPRSVKSVRHKLTPVGQQVTGKEIHFRLAEGKVALVPVEELVKRMRDEVVRRKNWLLKFPTHRGTVGPLGGFEMQYAVQREMRSALDELRGGGYGQIKIVLQGWKIEPTAELQAETAERALQPDSKFLRELHVAENGTTVTFWVYPDSYAAFRKLQAAAHRDGLRVAARPLPFGIGIAGSPRGSRSSGQ